MTEEPKKTLVDKLKAPLNELLIAIKADKLYAVEAKDPQNPIQPNENKSAWLKKYWYIPVFGAFLVIGLINSRPNTRNTRPRSHHGVNKYGKRY